MRFQSSGTYGGARTKQSWALRHCLNALLKKRELLSARYIQTGRKLLLFKERRRARDDGPRLARRTALDQMCRRDSQHRDKDDDTTQGKQTQCSRALILSSGKGESPKHQRAREREGREAGEEYTERVYALWQVALGVCFASSCLCSGARGQAIHSIALAMFTRQEQTWRPCSDVRFHLRRAICTFSPFPEGSSFHFFTLKPQVATQPRHNSSRKQSSRLRTA